MSCRGGFKVSSLQSVDSLLSLFSCASANSLSGVSTEQREALRLYASDLEALHDTVCEFRKLKEVSYFYLETCHRIEVYLYGATQEEFFKILEATPLKRSVKSLQIFQDQAAVEHLFKVTSSLESQVLGETEISGQMKLAIQKAKENNHILGTHYFYFDAALKVNKKIRKQTKLGEGEQSVALSALRSLEEFYEDYRRKTFLVIGAGTMALRSLSYLKKLGVEKIIWANRSSQKILNHPYVLNAEVQPLPFEMIYKKITEVDVVLSAVRTQQPIVEFHKFKEAMKSASVKSESLKVFLDLGMPRNVEEEIHLYGNAYVLGLDAFENRVQKVEEKKLASLRLAEEIIELSVHELKKDLEMNTRAQEISKLIQLLNHIDEVLDTSLTVDFSEKIGYNRQAFRILKHSLIECFKRSESLEVEKIMGSLQGLKDELALFQRDQSRNKKLKLHEHYRSLQEISVHFH